MGLIKAITGAAGGVLADQWKEYFYCDALNKETLVAKGQKKITGRSSNYKGDENIISNGSGIVVNEGQCMMIVEQGKVVELCAEPGEFTYDASTEPSIFSGSLKDSIKDTFRNIGKRFTYGGEAPKDQRVYYFNTKEIGDNKFGTASPIPFRVVDEEMGFRLSVDLRCNGVYSYKITDPMLFYTNVCSNISDTFDRSEIDGMLKGEFMDALQPAFAKIAVKKIAYYEIPAHTTEIADELNEVLSSQWKEKRGIEIFSIAVNSISVPEDQRKKITEWEENSMTRDPLTAAARLVGSQSDTMRTAAANESGAFTGFMGMGMAMNQGGMNARDLYAIGQQMQQQQQQYQQPSAPASPAADSWKCSCGNTATGNFCPNCGNKKPEPKPASDSWKCSCGATVNGKFCTECGAPKPAQQEGWTCQCGAVNQGKFCTECGAKKPAGAPLYRCDKCGWQPADPKNPPKFCPECGDIFNDNDIQ